MRTAPLAALCALLLVPLATQAQTVRGTVVDDDTGAAISAARVELFTQDREPLAATESDRAGVFELAPRRSGHFVVRVTHLGYAPIDSAHISLRAGESVTLEVRLGRTAIALEPLVVTARRGTAVVGFYERQRRGGLGRYITRDQIERRPAARASDLLRTLPGVYVESAQLGRSSMITMRGGVGRCLPTIYIDGMPMRQYPESSVDDWIHASSLEGVEVYTSFASAPSPLHASGACGVIAFWTRVEDGSPWTWRRFAVAAGLAGLILFFGLR
jgi:hypothetical protein